MKVYLVSISVCGVPFTHPCEDVVEAVNVLDAARERLKLDIDMGRVLGVLSEMSCGSTLSHRTHVYSIRVEELDEAELGVYFE